MDYVALRVGGVGEGDEFECVGGKDYQPYNSCGCASLPLVTEPSSDAG